MGTILLISGMWQGGWCWVRVARILRSRGHTVLAPTLDGLGSRRWRLRPGLDLSAHIGEVVGHARRAGGPLIGCGHSYGGTVLLHAADAVPDAFDGLVLLDANFSISGVSVIDRYGPQLRESIMSRLVEENGVRVLPPRAPQDLGVTHPLQALIYARSMTPHPFETMSERRELRGRWSKVAKKVAVFATDGPRGSQRQKVRAEAMSFGFEHRETRGGHQLMHTRPEAVAELLHELAAGTGGPHR